MDLKRSYLLLGFVSQAVVCLSRVVWAGFCRYRCHWFCALGLVFL